MFGSKAKKYDLNGKFFEFLRKYSAGTRGGYDDWMELRDFVEAKAVFAELRWPEVYGKIISSSEDEAMSKNTVSLVGDGVLPERMHMAGNDFRVNSEFSWDKFDWTFNKHFHREALEAIEKTGETVDLNVLRRVIERGRNRVGSRRGVLFAKEFGLDINLPMSYAVDMSDPHLHDYLIDNLPQLNLDTVCPINYFYRNSLPIEEVTFEEVLLRLNKREIRHKSLATAAK